MKSENKRMGTDKEMKDNSKLSEAIRYVVSNESILSERARELAIERGLNKYGNYTYDFHIDNIEYDDDGALVCFCERTGHDYPERLSVHLSFDKISMSDNKWKEYIQSIIDENERKKKEINEKKRLERENKKKTEKARKMKQYLKLKKELNQ